MLGTGSRALLPSSPPSSSDPRPHTFHILMGKVQFLRSWASSSGLHPGSLRLEDLEWGKKGIGGGCWV